MARGGYQPPSSPAGASGPGRFSKRTDGQAVRVDSLDNPDVQYGQRSMLEGAQKIAPLRGAEGAGRRPTGEQAVSRQLPPWLFEQDSARPLEPPTAGLSIGAGPGPEALSASEPSPDVREQVLEGLWLNYGNEQARQMLVELRDERMASTPVSVPLGGPLG